MKTITAGHDYELASFEGGAPQTIKFINKQRIYSQEDVGRIGFDACEAMRAKGAFPDDCEHAGYEAGEAARKELITVHDGTTNEEVLSMLIDRMYYLQKLCPCRENAIVITKLEESLMWLDKRTDDRMKRKVEGSLAK